MDQLEVRLRRLFSPSARKVVRLPVWAQLSVSLALAFATFAFVYGLYSLALGA